MFSQSSQRLFGEVITGQLPLITVKATLIVLLISQASYSQYTNEYSQRNDASSILASAFEQAGLSFVETPSPSSHSPHYVGKPQRGSMVYPGSPKSSLFWRLRFPFRTLKETNRAIFGRPPHPPPSPSYRLQHKPLKFDIDEADYTQLMGNYRRPRLSFPGVYGFQPPDYDLKGTNVRKFQSMQGSNGMIATSSLPPPMPPPVSSTSTYIENIMIKPLPSNDLRDSHVARESLRKETKLKLTEETDKSDKYAKLNKYDKFKSIRYDYSGFKPMGPGSSSQLLSSSYPSGLNGSNNRANSSVSRDPKYYELAEDDLDNEMSENSMETFSTNQLFHPEKVEPDNKIILPINPTDLLRLVSEETRNNDKPIECANKDLGWCDLGDQYPTEFVESIIRRCQRSVDRMYVEIPANLEDYQSYKPFKFATLKNASLESSSEESSSESSTDSITTTTTLSPNGDPIWPYSGGDRHRPNDRAFCESERKFIRPIIAQDINGNWYLIAQTSLYHQQIPVEVCSKPGSPCNKISKCAYKARCVQRFITQLLISIDMDKEKECPMMKLYRFPSSCICEPPSL